MELARVKDWLIGAGATLLVLVVAAAIFWWTVSEPGDAKGQPGPSPPVDAQRSPGARPPANLGKDEIWLSDLSLDAATVVTEGSRLRHVRAAGHDVVTKRDRLLAGRLTVDATVPFEVVAHDLGHGTLVRPAEGGQVTVVRTVEALGRRLRIVATGTVKVQAGRLVVEPRSIDVGGPKFLADATAAVVRRLVTIEYDIQGLPKGLVLHHVDVRSDGFRAGLRGQDVKLVP